MKTYLLICSVTLGLVLCGAGSVAWGKTVNLAWDPSPSQVTGYKVYYGSNSAELSLNGTDATEGASPIDVGNVLTFTLTGLDATAEHSFAVTAYDAAGAESDYSNLVSSPAETQGTTQPGANQPPVFAAIGDKSVLEGATLSFTVAATDPDGDALTYGTGSLPPGAAFDPASRAFNWQPGSAQAGVYPVDFHVSDGQLTATEQISITVMNVNQIPVLEPIGTKIVNEGEELAFTVLATDADGDALSYSATSLPAGAVFNPSTRQFRWTPDYSGSANIRIFSVVFIVSDGLAEDDEQVTINVHPVNRPPLLEPIGPQSLTAGDNYNLILQGSDPDNNPLAYSAENLPAGAVFISSTRSFSWIPGNDQVGTHSVTFAVSDGALTAREEVVFTVAGGNEPPVFDPIGSKVVDENSLLSFVVSATDVNGDSLTYSASGLPPGATFDPAGQRFSWTPDFDQAGTFTVVFSVSDGTFSTSETVTITVHNANRPPQISGQPSGRAMVEQSYYFAPTASDPDGDSISFSISGLPFWATFNQQTGALTGTPVAQDVGVSSNIVISVSDGRADAALPAFSIEVATAADETDSDSGSEALDSDGDGIPDSRDGFPYDPTRADWVIRASAGSGGYIDPVGETSVLYGGAKRFTITPMAGYYINDLLVDGVSVGLSDSHLFENVDSHHAIEAVFSAIPEWLSHDPVEAGLIGIERLDGGDDSHNLVDGRPRQDLEYRFHVVMRTKIKADRFRVFVVINGYRYEMDLAEGVLATGARYSMTTRLGPAYAHRFHFELEDRGTIRARFPVSGDLPGPAVELLNGHNLIGIPGNIDPYALSAADVAYDNRLYRWHPDGADSGTFELVDAGAPVAAGEGYLFSRGAAATLAELRNYGQISNPVHEFVVTPGWNLIANPYGGSVALTQVQVRAGKSEPVDWLTAVSRKLIADGVTSYLGEDWGGRRELASAAGSDPARLVPWIGYWIYVEPTDQPISLLIPKPLN
ncbi:MAG: putative Ig domain-containing protein [Pelovirga sp.]